MISWAIKVRRSFPPLSTGEPNLRKKRYSVSSLRSSTRLPIFTPVSSRIARLLAEYNAYYVMLTGELVAVCSHNTPVRVLSSS